jgi:galactose mutarotase-like enzyme
VIVRHFGARVTDRLSLDGCQLVVLENRKLRITFRTGRGGDIIEFLYKPRDVDFLWRSREASRRGEIIPTAASAGPFRDYYVGGWQVLFPHASFQTVAAGAELGFHGELWGLPWEHAITRDDPDGVEALFRVRTVRTPFLLERRVSLDAEGSTLRIHETVVNEGVSTLDFMWGHHPAFGPPFLDEECIVECPAASARIGGVVHPWPKDESGRDHSRLRREDSPTEIMKYLQDLREGWVAVTNPREKVGIGLAFDAAVFPYVWLWQEFGYTREYPWYGRAYVMGVEPQSSLPGARESGGRLLRLDGGASMATELRAVVYEGSGVDHIAPDGSVKVRR